MNRVEPARRALGTDATDTSFASKVPTTTEPAGNGVLRLASGPGGSVPCWALLWPIATAGNDDTFDLRVLGWRRIGSGGPGATLWFPSILGQFTCTLSTAVGVAGAPVVATERFADTIVNHATVTGAQGKTTDTDSGGAASTGTTVIYSPGNNLIGWVKMPIGGFEKLELLFDTTAAGTTAMNCLIAFL